MNEGWWSVGGVVCLSVLLALIVVHSIMTLIRVCRWNRMLLPTIAKTVVEEILLGAGLATPTTLLDRRIHELVEEDHVCRIRLAARVQSHIAIFPVTWMVLEIAFGSEFNLLLMNRILFHVVITAVSLWWATFPNLVTRSSVRLVWFIHCFLEVINVFMYSGLESLPNRVNATLACRVIMAAYVANLPMATVANLVILVCHVLVHNLLSCGHDIDTIHSEIFETACVKPPPSTLVFHMLVSLIAVVLVAWIFQYHAKVAAKYRFKAGAAAQAEKKKDNLLTTKSDIILHLDQNLNIVGPSHKLAGLLHRHDSNPDLDGCCFLDLLVNADREYVFSRFSSSSSDMSEDESPAVSMLHTHLLDVWRRPVSVQLFFNSFKNLNCESCFILGICERLNNERGPLEERDALSTISEGSASTVEESRCLATVGKEISVWLHAASFQIARASPGFLASFGQSFDGVQIVQWIDDDDEQAKFMMTLQDAVNNFFNENSEKGSSGTVRFQPPGPPLTTYTAAFHVDVAPVDHVTDFQQINDTEAALFSVEIKISFLRLRCESNCSVNL
eukprot:TRINITY_DN61110_c0_g1_i1.p1 TRINITY_DN61110_c0_g1~~TRINITY_DN61110_c0_g1_i1.p1  ORF type:complete len:559 (-),score=56.56 TRINITY_DN61110_c0_g1_i1:43-1719(-)